jgi:hypothetical protein
MRVSLLPEHMQRLCGSDVPLTVLRPHGGLDVNLLEPAAELQDGIHGKE